MSDAPATAPPTPAETLAREEAGRTRAAIAAWLAGILTLVGGLVSIAAQHAIPNYGSSSYGIGKALSDLSAGHPAPAGAAVRTAKWIGDHPVGFIVAAALTALGALAAFVVLAYLFRAARARAPQISQFPLIAAAIGCVSFAIGSIVTIIARVSASADLGRAATNEDVLDIAKNGFVLAGGLLSLIGVFGFALAFVLTSLNAMRVGLLTRFMGILGMIAGATLIIQQLDPPGVIRAFWLFAVGFLLVGRWPNGVPPAWETGKAEPWPPSRPPRAQQAQSIPATPPETPAPQLPEGDGLTAGQRRKKRKKK